MAASFVLASQVVFAEEASQVPSNIQSLFQQVVGNWTIESTESGETSAGKFSLRMAPGGFSVFGTAVVRSGNERSWVNLVTAWDSSTGGFTEQAVRSDGMISTVRLTETRDNVWEGRREATVDGKALIGHMRFEVKGPNEMFTEITERKLGDESLPDRTIEFTRIVKEKKSRPEKK
jgi:hypothetical protein